MNIFVSYQTNYWMNLFEIYKHSVSVLSRYFDEHESEALTSGLMAYHFQCSKTGIFISGKDVTPSAKGKDDYLHDLDRLKSQEPLAYITGIAFFNDFELRVNENVLIPRPETEEVVNYASRLNQDKSSKILDMGTGSGCIALSLKKTFPESRVFACDISEKALSVAQSNAHAYHLDIGFFLMDILNKRQWNKMTDPLSLIISNPPYVRQSEKKLMKKNVLQYEPPAALFVPDDNPLIFYKSIVEFSKSKLLPRGYLVLEINETLALQTAELLDDTCFNDISIHRDINDKDRFISAQKFI